jgi:hypothetical protein
MRAELRVAYRPKMRAVRARPPASHRLDGDFSAGLNFAERPCYVIFAECKHGDTTAVLDGTEAWLTLSSVD